MPTSVPTPAPTPYAELLVYPEQTVLTVQKPALLVHQQIIVNMDRLPQKFNVSLVTNLTSRHGMRFTVTPTSGVIGTRMDGLATIKLNATTRGVKEFSNEEILLVITTFAEYEDIGLRVSVKTVGITVTLTSAPSEKSYIEMDAMPVLVRIARARARASCDSPCA